MQYLNAETKTPLRDNAAKTTYYAAVTETAPYIEGYVADSVTKARVLSASELSGDAAAEEELQNNVIIFFYTPSDNSALYQVDHYVQDVEGSGYSLYYSETNSGTRDESVTVASIRTGTIAAGLTSSGFSFADGSTTVSVNGAAATPAGESITLTGEPTIVSVYYDRSSYGYTVKYVDYDQEKLYDSDSTLWNGELYSATYTDGDKKRLGTDVEITAPTAYTYTNGESSVNYTRISDAQPILTIRHDNPDAPTKNIIKVYYKKDIDRQLNYRIVCDRETSDTFAVLSQSTEIVANLTEVKGSTVTPLTLDDHEYDFLGWYSTREAEGDPLSTGLHYAPASLPGADMTYYAVFHQKTVVADIEVWYNDTGVYTGVLTSTEDTDGSVTGHVISFTSPDGYAAGTETALDNTTYFTFGITNPIGKLYPYVFAGWYTPDGNPVEPEPGESTFSLPRTASCRYIAMFRPRDSVSYEIKYRFMTRAHDQQDYIVKGTLSGEDLTTKLKAGSACELTDAFVLSQAPYESNYGETLSWSDTQIVRDSTESGGIVSTVTAVQNAKKVYANYRLYPSDEYTTIETTIGANRETDPALAVINARYRTHEGKAFSYWEIKKSASGAPVAKCYDAWFTFCMIDTYWITPVYNGAVTPESTGITLTHLDYSRNRWTDENGEIDSSGETDLLYTDFEIAFEDGENMIGGADSGYRAGVVFELCGKMGASAVFDPERNYGFYSDADALKAAIKVSATSYSTKNKEDSDTVKRRSIQCSEIDTANITAKNRIEFAQYYRNAYTLVTSGEVVTKNYSNSVYLMKATAYLVKGDEVTLSNSVYICFKTEAEKELAIPAPTTGE